jgi:hypothetical protein
MWENEIEGKLLMAGVKVAHIFCSARTLNELERRLS